MLWLWAVQWLYCFSCRQCGRRPAAAQPRQRSAPSVLPLSVCGCLCGFIGHFLVIKGIKHIFFICLLNVCEPCLVKCLFRSTVYFIGFSHFGCGFLVRASWVQTLRQTDVLTFVWRVYTFCCRQFWWTGKFTFGNIQFPKFFKNLWLVFSRCCLRNVCPAQGQEYPDVFSSSS